MIPDELQDQAALYVIDALGREEAAAFEKVLAANAELRAMVREMCEAAADLAHAVPPQQPPAELKRRVLREVALEKQSAGAGVTRSTSSFAAWLPWAIAALFLIFCGVLAVDRARLQRQLAEARRTDSLGEVTFVTLTSPAPGHEAAKVAVAWQPDKQSGLITISNMPPAGTGRDYQLWAVDAKHKDPINAGIIRVDSRGITRVHFKPDRPAKEIKAFAISLEREGGVPKREGPIVMIGNV